MSVSDTAGCWEILYVFKTFVGWIKRTFRTTTRRRHSVLTTGDKNETFPQTEAETRLNWTHQSHFHFRCECFNRFFFWSSRLYSSRFTFWMFFCAAGLISHQHAQIWSVKTASWPESLTEGDETDGAESLWILSSLRSSRHSWTFTFKS